MGKKRESYILFLHRNGITQHGSVADIWYNQINTMDMMEGDRIQCTYGIDGLFTYGEYYRVKDVLQYRELGHTIHIVLNDNNTIHRFIGCVEHYFTKCESIIPLEHIDKHKMI